MGSACTAVERHVGREHVFVAVADRSRMAFDQIDPDESSRRPSGSGLAPVQTRATTRGRRAPHQNCHCPLRTTQMPSTPLVTAWAITDVHSLPVRTYSHA